MGLVYLRCGHRTSPAYIAPKILWVRTHQPEIYVCTAKFLVPKDYLVHRLTGEFATDYSDASGTLLFDLTTRTRHRPFLDALGCLPINLRCTRRTRWSGMSRRRRRVNVAWRPARQS